MEMGAYSANSKIFLHVLHLRLTIFTFYRFYFLLFRSVINWLRRNSLSPLKKMSDKMSGKNKSQSDFASQICMELKASPLLAVV